MQCKPRLGDAIRGAARHGTAQAAGDISRTALQALVFPHAVTAG